MKCKKCDKSNPEGSKFCAACGSSLEEKKSFEHQDLFDKVTSHLEYIGYELGKAEEIDEGKHLQILAKNKNRSNLFITFNSSGTMTFVSFYMINKEKVAKKRNEVLEAVNKMNLTSLVCSFSLADGNGSLTCSSWYPNEYSKKSFSDFLETYEADIKARFNSSGIMEYA